MEVVSQAIAEKEVNDWLEYKKIPEAYIKGSPLYINGMVISVKEGTFVIDPITKEITHKLKWPIGAGEFLISELKYKARVPISAIQANCAGLSPLDQTGKTIGIMAALCGKPRTEIGSLDSEDVRSASDVAAFFYT